MFGLWFSLKVHGLQIGAPSFLGVSYPNLLLVFLNLLFLGTCIIFFSQVLGLSLGLFYVYRYFSAPYFGLACDHGNSLLCLEEQEREGYWIEVRTVSHVKTTRLGDAQKV